MRKYHKSDVAIEIEEAKHLDDLHAIYWACREAEAVASLIVMSLGNLIEECGAEMSLLNRIRDVGQSAGLIRRRMQAVTCGVEHAELKIRKKLLETATPAAELARAAEAMQAAEEENGRMNSHARDPIDSPPVRV